MNNPIRIDAIIQLSVKDKVNLLVGDIRILNIRIWDLISAGYHGNQGKPTFEQYNDWFRFLCAQYDFDQLTEILHTLHSQILRGKKLPRKLYDGE